MRVKTMKLPENLALEDVAEVVTRLGVRTDRTAVGRALRAVVIRRVREPEAPRGPWRIPRAALTEVVAACLLRRASRHPDRWALRPEKFLTTAVELMLEDDELREFVPRRLKAEVLERRRLEEERRRREREAREAAARDERERQAREVRARRLERERRALEKRERVVLDRCYFVCFLAAMDAVGAKEVRDWPAARPDWWLPPPGLREQVDEWLGDLVDIPDEHPDWRRWIPTYEPGKPWPWRKPEADDAAVPA
jgi:hypothetical protein